MKKYLFALAVLLSLSACIKVEDAPLCPSAPPAPAVANSTVTVPLNSNLSVSIVSPDPSVTYYWVGPPFYSAPTTYSGNPLVVRSGNPIYGNWSVIAQKGAGCSSDTTKFQVIPSAPSCAVGKDSFLLGSAIYRMNFVASYNNVSYNNYYQIQFQDGLGETLTFYFPNLPTTSGYYTLSSITSFYGEQGDLFCGITYNSQSGDEYFSDSGSLYVNVNGSTITMIFCGVTFSDSFYSINVDASGNFSGH
jgi:hypothetical protein